MSSARFLVYCPVGVKTGGPEALYQLCDALNSLGYKALIVPTIETTKLEPCYDFAMYQVEYLTNREVMPDDVLVIPEVVTRIPNWLAHVIQPANIVIWWLSVDNSPVNPFNSFEIRNNDVHPLWRMGVARLREKTSYRIKSIPIKTLHLLRHISLIVYERFSTSTVNLKRAKHYSQSHYANAIVSEVLSMKVGKLSDYVYGSENQELPKRKTSRMQKIIAINPFKGAELMSKFIDLVKDEVSFFELKDLDTKGIAQALSQADLYLDLGHFPGKDRIPREAILKGCPVFLAERGAARNTIDFCVASEFKVDLLTTTPTELRERILGLLLGNDIFESQLEFFYDQVSAKQIFFTEVQHLANIFSPKFSE